MNGDRLNPQAMAFVRSVMDLIVDRELFGAPPPPPPPPPAPSAAPAKPALPAPPTADSHPKFVPLDDFGKDKAPLAVTRPDEELFQKNPTPPVEPRAPKATSGPGSSRRVSPSPKPAAAPPPASVTPAKPPPPPSTPSKPPMPPAAANPFAYSVQYKPGTVGSRYAAPLPPIQATGLSKFEAEGLKALGLAINADTGEITGEPTTAGEHSFEVFAKATGAEGAVVRVDIACQLLINANPRSLWKVLEPPPEAPHKKEHEASLRIVEGAYLIVGASKRGRSHAHEAKFREDALRAEFIRRGGWHVGIVADGAGSAALSRLGSEIAVQTSLDEIRRSLEAVNENDFADMIGRYADNPGDAKANSEVAGFLYKVLVGAAHQAAKALEERAKSDAIPVRDISTTLILTIVRQVHGGVFVGSFSIGDGGAAIIGTDPPYVKTLTAPDSGEFAGQTRFLALNEFGDGVASRLRADFRKNFSAVVLMSDGVTDPYLPTENAFADPRQWGKLMEDIAQTVDLERHNRQVAGELLDWLDFWSPGNHDDRTIIVICP